MKHCTGCGLDLNTAAFGNNASNRDGLTFYCRECSNSRTRNYRKRHPETQQAATRKWESKNRQHRNEYALNKYYIRRYGMTRDEYVAQKAAAE